MDWINQHGKTVFSLSDGTIGTLEELASRVPGSISCKTIRRRLKKSRDPALVLESAADARKRAGWQQRWGFTLPNTPPQYKRTGQDSNNA